MATGTQTRTTEELRRLAYHEAGHAVVAYLVKRPFRHVTIIPKEDTWGHILYTKWPDNFDPENNTDARTQKRIECCVDTALGGDAAISLLTGEPCDLAYFDWQSAEDMATNITVDEIGMNTYLQWRRLCVTGRLNLPWHWLAVEELAGQLLCKGCIGARKARQIVQNTVLQYIHRTDCATLQTESMQRMRRLREAQRRTDYEWGVWGLRMLAAEKGNKDELLAWAHAELDRQMAEPMPKLTGAHP